MGFLNSYDITASALTAERFRVNIISQNLANQNVTRTANGEPYRRKQVVFQERELTFDKALSDADAKLKSGGVIVARVVESQADFVPVYDPTHPDADEDGYVQMPNVDWVKETIDGMSATRSYEANITAFNAIKLMAQKALEIGK